MAKDTFDRILTSTPLNSTAGAVTSRGEHWVPKAAMPANYPHWKEPPPMKEYEGPDLRHGSPNFIGKKVGRLTVVGILHNQAIEAGKNRGLRYVVKCACGDYEARSPQALKGLFFAAEHMSDDIQRSGDRCWPCSQLQVIQNRYKKNGSKPISHFTGTR